MRSRISFSQKLVSVDFVRSLPAFEEASPTGRGGSRRLTERVKMRKNPSHPLRGSSPSGRAYYKFIGNLYHAPTAQHHLRAAQTSLPKGFAFGNIIAKQHHCEATSLQSNIICPTGNQPLPLIAHTRRSERRTRVHRASRKAPRASCRPGRRRRPRGASQRGSATRRRDP